MQQWRGAEGGDEGKDEEKIFIAYLFMFCAFTFETFMSDKFIKVGGRTAIFV